MTDPLVSVLLTSYNQGEWLQEAIDSVVAQTLREWELLIIDNGSTDDSMEVIRRYEGHPRIRIIRHEQNRPVTIILNEGIRQARGKYFSLLQSDDYYLPEKLEVQVAELERLPDRVGVVYSSGYRLTPEGALVVEHCGAFTGDVLEAILTRPAFFLPLAPLVRMRCLREYPFDETIFIEGEGIYAKIALTYHFHPLPVPVVVMREHERNVGKEIESNLRRNVIMYEHLFDRPDFPPRLGYLRGIALAHTYRVGGWQIMRRERRYRQGREWLLAAARHDRRSLRNPRVLMGIAIGSLPRPLADRSMDALDRVMGEPPAPVDGPQSPVEAFDPVKTTP